jgi:hypothetical protein
VECDRRPRVRIRQHGNLPGRRDVLDVDGERPVRHRPLRAGRNLSDAVTKSVALAEFGSIRVAVANTIAVAVADSDALAESDAVTLTEPIAIAIAEPIAIAERH